MKFLFHNSWHFFNKSLFVHKLFDRINTANPEIKRMIADKLLCSKEDGDKRFAICVECEHFNGVRCRLCGCNMELKTRLRKAKCADKKNPKWQEI